jgi:hypothetical protein
VPARAEDEAGFGLIELPVVSAIIGAVTDFIVDLTPRRVVEQRRRKFDKISLIYLFPPADTNPAMVYQLWATTEPHRH